MADGDMQTNQGDRQQAADGRFRGRGPRDGGNRDAGGFRIRLSDNEMRAARSVQEAFGLRSTVAALGLALRTVAQLLEEGQLDAVVEQHRANAGSRPQGERRGQRGAERAGSRPNPFARPSRPAAVSSPEPAAEAGEASPEAEISSEATAEAALATSTAEEAAAEGEA